MVTALAHPLPALLASETRLRQVSQQTYDVLAASHQRIEQSRILIRRAHQKEDRTHALGVRYADWRLRLDIASELRHLTGGLDWH